MLLSGNGHGMDETVLFDGRDVGVRPQNLQVIVGEGPSETVDDVPLVRNVGLRADPAGNGGDTDRVVNVVLKGHDVTSGNRILGLLDSNEWGGSSEDWEDTKSESDELLGEHGRCLESWDVGFNE